jgi:hypothetical protein
MSDTEKISSEARPRNGRKNRVRDVGAGDGPNEGNGARFPLHAEEMDSVAEGNTKKVKKEKREKREKKQKKEAAPEPLDEFDQRTIDVYA